MDRENQELKALEQADADNSGLNDTGPHFEPKIYLPEIEVLAQCELHVGGSKRQCFCVTNLCAFESLQRLALVLDSYTGQSRDYYFTDNHRAAQSEHFVICCIASCRSKQVKKTKR